MTQAGPGLIPLRAGPGEIPEQAIKPHGAAASERESCNLASLCTPMINDAQHRGKGHLPACPSPSSPPGAGWARPPHPHFPPGPGHTIGQRPPSFLVPGQQGTGFIYFFWGGAAGSPPPHSPPASGRWCSLILWVLPCSCRTPLSRSLPGSLQNTAGTL